MASRSDGAKVDAVEYRAAGITVDVRLNKSKGLFSAEWGEKRWTDTNLVELKRVVERYLRESVTAEWKPVILFKATGSNRYSGRENEWVGLEIDRFYVAKIAGAMRQVKWQNYELDRRHREEKGTLEGLAASMIGSSQSFSWKDNGREFEPPISDHYDTDRRSYSYAGNDDPTTYLPYSDEAWATLLEMQRKIAQLRDAIQGFIKSNDVPRLLATFGMTLALPAPQETASDDSTN